MITGVALLADVQESRAIEDFSRLRDRALADLSRRHRQQGWCEMDYAVTAWDEFQGLLIDPTALPAAVWDIWRTFEPARLRLAIGGGAVESVRLSDEPPTVNTAFTGEAFYLARDALGKLATPRHGMSRVLVGVAWNDPVIQAACNSVLRLADALSQDITARQWEIIGLYEKLGKQTEVAAALDKSESTISRSLAASRYWEVMASLDELKILLQHWCGQAGNEEAIEKEAT